LRSSRLPRGLTFGAIVTDYDRTVTDLDLHLSGPVLSLLRKFQEGEGVAVVLATGRDLKFVRGIGKELGFMDALVCENGAVLWFPRDDRVVCLGDGSSAKAMLSDMEIPFEAGEVVVSVKETYEKELRAALGVRGRGLTLEANRGTLMVLPEGIDKASGVRRALAELGRHDAGLICIGDGENDLSLFSMASFKVATAEAVDSLKEAADFVCEGAGSAGVERFLLELIEGREAETPEGGR
jgi:phosphoglycolate phosphatase (TIGR01487 family)